VVKVQRQLCPVIGEDKETVFNRNARRLLTMQG
jgi:hypothetical protein